MKYFAIVYSIVVVLMSLVALIAYGIDKRRAKTDKRRISEKSLHLIALCGGWPGAIAGQRLFRHKTQKISFRIVFWFVLALHLAIVVGLGYLIYQWT